MKTILHLTILLALVCLSTRSMAQLPLVYDSENTGSDCPAPPLPDPSNLPSEPLLPDPFSWSDGSGRSTDFADWECRRNEIKAEVEHYELGTKPNRPEDISASYADGTLTVDVTVNNETLTITSHFSIPDGEGPFPVVIGMNSGTGSLPAALFEGVIQVPFIHDQIVTNNNNYNADDPYYRLYPELADDVIGHYSAWAWGFSRLLDGIELLQEDLKVDMQHVAVTGCSYAGKMALFSGAFDERVALTLVQESGGGGINSWRVAYDMVEVQGQEEVERISNTNYSWFKDDLQTNFNGANVARLPYDHHEIMAMVAPRALLVLGNPPWVWLGDESGYVSSKATEKVYETFGISDRFGYSFRNRPNHCALPDDASSIHHTEIQAFIDKFLWEDESADTNVRFQEGLDNVDYNRWIDGWEPPNPDAPSITIELADAMDDYEAPATVTLEATVTDINENVVSVEFFDGQNSLGEDTEAPYSITLSDLEAGTYYISAVATDSEDLSGTSNIVDIVVRSPAVEVISIETPPVIDGTIEDLWNGENVLIFEATNELVGENIDPSDLSATAKMVWNGTYIYLLAIVTDDEKVNDSPNTYEDDNVEFYFDSNNSKSSYDDNDVQYSFAWNEGTTVCVLPGGRSVEGITYSIVDTETGYIVEARIPWATIPGTPEDGKSIGFEFMINDDDDGDGRDGKLSWNATADQAWQDASLFGTVVLSGDVVAAPDDEVPDDENPDDDVVAGHEELMSGEIKVYPNPVSDQLSIEGLSGKFNFEIFDISGRLKLTGSNKEVISIESLSKGIYILNLTSASKTESIRFVKI